MVDVNGERNIFKEGKDNKNNMLPGDRNGSPDESFLHLKRSNSMNIDIDVSGEDLLTKNYTICIANNRDLIKGFKFSEEIVSILSARYGQGAYKYAKSQRGKSAFKVRLYCIILYYLFKSLDLKRDISLNICRDFDGRQEDIKVNLRVFLENKLGLDIQERYYFVKLSTKSNAHLYAYLMRNDTKNKMNTYVKINLGEIEQWIIK